MRRAQVFQSTWLPFALLPPIIVVGFWVPYFSKFPRFEPAITGAVHVHALLLFAWVALLIIQPLAIRIGARRFHRFAGRSSYLLMPLIVLFGGVMVRREYLQHIGGGFSRAAARSAEYLSASQLLFLVLFYCLSLAKIRHRDVAGHLRYMVCIGLVLLPPGLARALGYWFGVKQMTAQTICFIVIDLCLAGLVVADRRRRPQGGPYGVALVTYALFEAAWLALGRPV